MLIFKAEEKKEKKKSGEFFLRSAGTCMIRSLSQSEPVGEFYQEDIIGFF